MPDLLRTEASERVDLGDWRFATDSAIDAAHRHAVENVLTNPIGATRTWILEGFRMTNPASQQIQVTRGVALLARRELGQTRFGAIAAEGDANKIVDITSFAVGTYGIYIRFEYVDGDIQNRVFWNPSGLGSEFAQSIPTRRKANWSMRIELTSPGGEWTQIGTAQRTGGAPIIVDQRKHYFEGAVNAAYQSGWGTEGGGVANDRNADRQLHGVRDFQTFTAAVRQCLEDVKGRGIRRWWDPDVGGLNVGFSANAVEDRVAIGDADFFLQGGPAAPFPAVHFDSGDDRFGYNRATNQFEFQVAGSIEVIVNATGLQVLDGLIVGFTGTAGLDEVQVGDATFKMDWVSATDVRYQGDTNDYLGYDRTSNFWNAVIGSVIAGQFSSTGLRVTDGLVVGHTGAPIADIVSVGDAEFYLNWGSGTIPELIFQVTGGFDFYRFDRTNSFHEWGVANTVVGRARAGGLEAPLGMVVGFSATPTDDAMLVGDANFGLRFNIGGFGNVHMPVDSGDEMAFFRATNSFIWTANDQFIMDGNNGVFRLGATTTFTSPGESFYLAPRNNIRMLAVWSSGIVEVTSLSYGIVSITNPAGGTVDVDPVATLAVGGIAAVFGTCLSPGGTEDRYVLGAQISNTSIRFFLRDESVGPLNFAGCGMWVGLSGT